MKSPADIQSQPRTEAGELLVELAAREAGRRKHKNWKRVSALDLVDVLNELGFKIVVAS